MTGDRDNSHGPGQARGGVGRSTVRGHVGILPPRAPSCFRGVCIWLSIEALFVGLTFAYIEVVT